MNIHKKTPFIYLGTTPTSREIEVPYPNVGNAPFETQVGVDSARNANYVVVAQQLGRPNEKQSMKWNAMLPEKWWEINRFVNEHFMFYCTFFSFNEGVWKVRTFYRGNATANPYKIDQLTGRPFLMLDCSLNVIDTGKEENYTFEPDPPMQDSEPPTISPVYPQARDIVGTGIDGSTITVIFPDESTQTGIVTGTFWVIKIEKVIRSGDVIRAYQTEIGKNPSSIVSILVRAE